jgi:chromosome segregation ATPase
MSAAGPDEMKEDAAAKESAGTSQKVQPEAVSSEAEEQERKRLRAQVKKVSIYMAVGIVGGLVPLIIAAAVDFFYGEKREARDKVRYAENALTFEKEWRQSLERDLTKLRAELTESSETRAYVSSELATVKAALIAEREKRQGVEAANADFSKRIAKLTESLALVQQVLSAPDAKLSKAKDALDRMRKQHRDFMTGVELGRSLTGDDLSVLADILTAPDQLRSSKELTAATVEAYESRIQTVDSIVRSALAAEKHLSQEPTSKDAPSPKN